MNFTLYRFDPPHKNHPTFGALHFEGKPRFSTLELPWRGNQNRISCIPLGQYVCERVEDRILEGSGEKIPVTYLVTGVPGRSGILFHTGNLMRSTRGCILVGTGYGILEGQPAISESRKGFSRFLELTNNVEKFDLTVVQV